MTKRARRGVLFAGAISVPAALAFAVTGGWARDGGEAPVAAAGPEKPAEARIANPPQPFDPSQYDFAGGRKYPAPVTVDLRDAVMAPGGDEARIIVALSAPSPNTVVAHLKCTYGGGAQVESDREQSAIFRPGDPLLQTVSCKTRSADPGDKVRFLQTQVPDGAKRGRAEAFVQVSANQPVTPALTDGFRAPLRFEPQGNLVYSAAGSDIQFDDRGGRDSWSTSLSHGRTQPGNKENGYYGTVAMGGFRQVDGDLVLSTRKLAQPVKAGAKMTPHPFLAAALSAHNTPDLHFRYGSVEWIAKLPNRRGSWPAFWLLAASGWPPEIDIFEGFGYNRDWRFAADLSSNLHGGKNNVRTFTRLASNIRMSDFGLSNNLTSQFHKFQARVDEDWITIFVDDVETMRYANPFAGQRWYPIMNVAVRADRASGYDDGSGDMAIRSVKLWRRE